MFCLIAAHGKRHITSRQHVRHLAVPSGSPFRELGHRQDSFWTTGLPGPAPIGGNPSWLVCRAVSTNRPPTRWTRISRITSLSISHLTTRRSRSLLSRGSWLGRFCQSPLCGRLKRFVDASTSERDQGSPSWRCPVLPHACRGTANQNVPSSEVGEMVAASKCPRSGL